MRIDGAPVNVWDYYGSQQRLLWSTHGPAEALRAVFGDAYHDGLGR